MATKRIIDCGTGQERDVPTTAGEDAALAAAQAELSARMAPAPQRAADIATLRSAAGTNPALAAVARLLGVL